MKGENPSNFSTSLSILWHGTQAPHNTQVLIMALPLRANDVSAAALYNALLCLSGQPLRSLFQDISNLLWYHLISTQTHWQILKPIPTAYEARTWLRYWTCFPHWNLYDWCLTLFISHPLEKNVDGHFKDISIIKKYCIYIYIFSKFRKCQCKR